MHFFRRIYARFSRDPEVLDHVPVTRTWQEGWTLKLQLAAHRHGKPFKCAADGLPRQVCRYGMWVVADAPESNPADCARDPTPQVAFSDTVPDSKPALWVVRP